MAPNKRAAKLETKLNLKAKAAVTRKKALRKENAAKGKAIPPTKTSPANKAAVNVTMVPTASTTSSESSAFDAKVVEAGNIVPPEKTPSDVEDIEAGSVASSENVTAGAEFVEAGSKVQPETAPTVAEGVEPDSAVQPGNTPADVKAVEAVNLALLQSATASAEAVEASSMTSSENSITGAKVIEASGKSVVPQKSYLHQPVFSSLFNPKIAESLESMDKEKNRPANFMSLPVELRIMIYKDLLVIPYSVNLMRRTNWFGLPLKSDMQNVPGIAWGSRSVLLRRRVAFLATNKTICAEASPFLYGGNIFNFDSYVMLKHFLVMIGDNVRFLKHVSMALMSGDFNSSDARLCFTLLAHAKELQIFNVGKWYHQSAWSAFDKMQPMVLALVKGLNDPYAALNVVRLTKSAHPKAGGCQCEEEFRESLRVGLKQWLTPRT